MNSKGIIQKKIFTTIPKEVLMDKTRLCALLRSNLREFDLDSLSHGLFAKNSGLIRERLATPTSNTTDPTTRRPLGTQRTAGGL